MTGFVSPPDEGTLRAIGEQLMVEATETLEQEGSVGPELVVGFCPPGTAEMVTQMRLGELTREFQENAATKAVLGDFIANLLRPDTTMHQRIAAEMGGAPNVVAHVTEGWVTVCGEEVELKGWSRERTEVVMVLLHSLRGARLHHRQILRNAEGRPRAEPIALGGGEIELSGGRVVPSVDALMGSEERNGNTGEKN